MIEKCHTDLSWYSIESTDKNDGLGWTVSLLVRWDESEGIGQMGEPEFSYSSYRMTIELPAEVQPRQESIEFYLDQIKDAIILKAQTLLSQDEGFA